MITEDYVNKEIAKLLRDKCFNEHCYTCYLNGELSHYDYLSTNFELIDDVISAPTLQMVMKWLREVHHVMIVLIPISFKKKSGYNKWECELYIEGVFERMNSKFSTYEEACEAAIKYALKNLI